MNVKNYRHMTSETQRPEPLVQGRFSGLKLLVTGAGSGIGLASAVRLSREGGKIIACDIDAGRLRNLVEEHPELNFVSITGDVREASFINNALTACGERLNGLVNNVGINDGFVPLDEVTDELWDKIVSVNLTAPCRFTRALMPLLLCSSQRRLSM